MWPKESEEEKLRKSWLGGKKKSGQRDLEERREGKLVSMQNKYFLKCLEIIF